MPNRAAEDYLKTLWSHQEWPRRDAQPITPSALAARLGLAPSTVTEMVKKLVAQGLVAHAPYGSITLTDDGRREALAIVRTHRLIETFLVAHLGYDWDEVHDEAEQLEHVVSPMFLERIDALLGHPTRDPHGDPIPAADGTIDLAPSVCATDLGVGDRGAILRISDRDPAVLRRLAEHGVGPDAVVRMTADGAVADTADGVLPLGDAAQWIWVTDPEEGAA